MFAPNCFSLLQFYAFSTFAMQLNELDKSMEGVLPPTDSRLRPDIRAMENGDIGTVSFLCCCNDLIASLEALSFLHSCVLDLASSQKKRLEEKQRTARKNRSKSTEEWKIRLVGNTIYSLVLLAFHFGIDLTHHLSHVVVNYFHLQ